MPNQKGQNQSQSSKRQPPPATPDDDMGEQNPRELSQPEDASQDSDQTPDRVEIGDPVPEDNRTIKARGQGETGEDEDLPDDDGSIETSGRH